MGARVEAMTGVRPGTGPSERPDALSPERITQLARDCAAGAVLRTFQQKQGKRVCRMALEGSRSVVIKLWSARGLRARARQWLGRSPLEREITVLRELHARGAPVPAPLGCVRLQGAEPWHGALALEDLEGEGDALGYVKTLLERADGPALERFEDGLVRLTQTLLAAGVVDRDHALYNVIVSPGRAPMRVDFELARCVSSAPAARARCGPMLGCLIGSYTLAVQPEVERAERLARELAAALRPPARALAGAQRTLDSILATQRRTRGVDTRLELGW